MEFYRHKPFARQSMPCRDLSKRNSLGTTKMSERQQNLATAAAHATSSIRYLNGINDESAAHMHRYFL